MKLFNDFLEWADDSRVNGFKWLFFVVTVLVWMLCAVLAVLAVVILSIHYFQWGALVIPFFLFFVFPVIWWRVDVYRENKKMKRQMKELA